MKIDLRKAYDSVHWECVEKILASLNFPPTFITWIMAYISTPTFKIHMNGATFDRFEGGRGLRQGDPLLPLLFVLIMECLSQLFENASTKSGFKFHPQCKNNKMVHLIFADDLIVFSAVEKNTI